MRGITNLLAATASATMDDQLDSSDDSDEELLKATPAPTVTMDFVRRALDGIAAQSTDDGKKGFGRHASIIRMGRALWQTPPLKNSEERDITEHFRRRHCASFGGSQQILCSGAEGTGSSPSTLSKKNDATLCIVGGRLR